VQSCHSRASLSCDQGHGCPIRCSCRLAPSSAPAAHAEPGRTREECCPGITAPERNRTGVNRPALPFTLTGVWRHATDRNSSSPSTSVGIHLRSMLRPVAALPPRPPDRSVGARPAAAARRAGFRLSTGRRARPEITPPRRPAGLRRPEGRCANSLWCLLPVVCAHASPAACDIL